MAAARYARFKGEFQILDSTGKKTEITKPIDQTIELESLTHVIQTIDQNTTDQAIGFAGVVRAKTLYIDPAGVEITVKLQQNTAPSFKINKPTIIFGEITALYITTGADEVVLEALIGGTAN